MKGLSELKRKPLGIFVMRLVRRFRASHVTLLAAALAYYAAFSLGPLLLLLGGWLGVVLQTRPDLADRYRTLLGELVHQILPLEQDSAELVSRSFEVVIAQLSQGAVLRSVLSLLVLVWASSGFFTSLQLALEVIFDIAGSRGFIRKRLVAVLLVVAVALVMGVEIIGGALLSSLAQFSNLLAMRLDLPEVQLPVPEPEGLARISATLVRIVLSGTAFALAFRFLPRTGSSWSGALVGAAFSAVSIALTRALLLLTFDAERFNLIYGVITAVVLTLLWLYLALLLFLCGALLTAEISSWLRDSREVSEAPT